MKKTLKRLLATMLAVMMVVTLTVTAFAAKTTDIKTKSTSEFGTLTGWQGYSGRNGGGRKEVVFETTITKLSSTSINTTLYAQVDIHDYKTGKYLDYDRSGATNKMETSYYWEGHSSAANDNLISSFGAHEARRSGSAVVYTNIYGF